MQRLIIGALGFLLTAGVTFADAPTGRVYSRAVVAADHPLASEAGTEILRGGGNVVDAAVATAFALSVVRPESCGLGGGGFMVYWSAEAQRAYAIDYRERAPAAAHRDMYLTDAGKPADPLASRVGGLAVAVPGHVAGLCFALKEFGTLDRQTVLQPAMRLATEGVPVDEHWIDCQESTLRDFEKHPEYADRYSALMRLYLNDGNTWEPNDRFRSPLKDVLVRIVDEGADGFFRGPVAEAIVAEIHRQGGIITLDDLADTQAVLRTPLRGSFDEYEIVSMPPPSSGGVAILQTLNILTEFERRQPDCRIGSRAYDDPDSVHLVTEAMKHAFADRAEFLGDPDFADLPIERLTSHEFAAQLAETIRVDKTLPLRAYGTTLPVSDGGTSHFCVIDTAGNAVACTETINTTFGSYVVEPRYGIVLNNEMDDFSAVPGEPNAFGLIQSEANAVEAGKKPLSSMSPTIFVKDGKATLVAGASGGPRIISATLLTLLNLTRYGMSVGEAVSTPRYHHQWVPETLFVEPPLLPAVREPLQNRGHEVVRRSELAAVQAAVRTDAGVIGASDPRKGGRPAGW